MAFLPPARNTRNVMLTAGNATPPKDNGLVLREIAEIKDCLIAFEFAVESREFPDPQNTIRSHGES